MAGTLALTRAELRRLFRNRRYFIFTVGFPVVLYLLVGKNVSAKAYGISFAAYYMVTMAIFGAFSGALTGNAQRISQEKKDGWIRQLRLTPLPANAYVISKILVSMVATVPSIVIVLLLGRFYGDVHLPPGSGSPSRSRSGSARPSSRRWPWPSATATRPTRCSRSRILLYFVFAILGGLWFPLSAGSSRTSASSRPPTRR